MPARDRVISKDYLSMRGLAFDLPCQLSMHPPWIFFPCHKHRFFYKPRIMPRIDKVMMLDFS